MGGHGIFGALQIMLCRSVQGVVGKEGKSLGLSLPLPLRHSVGSCPTGFWPLLGPEDAEKECQVSAWTILGNCCMDH